MRPTTHYRITYLRLLTCSLGTWSLLVHGLLAHAADSSTIGTALLEPARLSPAVRFQSDYELTRRLVEKAQAQLGDFEFLADEYERFQDLEERLSSQGNHSQLATALRECAERIQEVIQRRHLTEQFTPDFMKQIDRSATLNSISTSEDTSP